MPDSISRGGPALANAVRALYQEGQTDYSFEPLVRVGSDGSPVGRIQDGDAVIFCCRRGEREVELTEAFVDHDLDTFPRAQFQDLLFVILTLYHEKFKDLPVAFAPTKIQSTLNEVVSRAGLRQLHTSESEKFAHVTFFFNGGNNAVTLGEDDVRIPSLKGVPFDRAPELSLPAVADRVIEGLQQGYDLIVTNFANGDVIGHTANREAKIACAAALDTHLGRVITAAHAAGYLTLVTADHGNLEVLYGTEGAPHVSHTTNLVPFVMIDPRAKSPAPLRDGALADIAPTILAAMKLPQPPEMSGATLAPHAVWNNRRRVLLVILDGWGIGSADESNPIHLAATPVWDELLRAYPNSALRASGEAVGLQPGKAGNSEAGHLNIGAGRVVLQDDVRLDQALHDGTFVHNEIFQQAIQKVQANSGALHLIGLLTEKSSHGSIDYPLELLRMAHARGLDNVYLHLIFDGRSTEPGSAPLLLDKLETAMRQIGAGQIAGGVGRGIALDRDGNYGKIQRAYNALVFGQGRAYTE